jgi:hypothetical protein
MVNDLILISDLSLCFIDMKDLEKKLRTAIVHGHSRTNRPWKKIIIVVEGVYRLVIFEIFL